MIEVIKSPQPFAEKKQWTVFLAGPMNGAPSWQAQAPKVAEKVGIENLTMLNPRKTDRFVTGTYQVNWETFGLRMCDVILFWIPPQAREMKPHRVYAITTRMEMAENLARGHKVIIGIDPECADLTGILSGWRFWGGRMEALPEWKHHSEVGLRLISLHAAGAYTIYCSCGFY